MKKEKLRTQALKTFRRDAFLECGADPSLLLTLNFTPFPSVYIVNFEQVIIS